MAGRAAGGGGGNVEENREILKRQFTDRFPGERYKEGWADFWDKGDFLPWDKGSPSPALEEVLTSYTHLVGSPYIIGSGGQKRRKRALVPGCGRGVDVLLLHAFGYDAIGLDVAEKAVEACHAFVKEHKNDELYKTRRTSDRDGPASIRFVQGDFFSDDWLDQAGFAEGEDKRFELIYDYTFFCAMQPDMRPAWSKRMSELLAPNQFSNLVCLEFPALKPASAGGPPFSSPSKAYMEHLSHPGERIEYTEGNEVKVNPFVEVGRGGLERLIHFHPTETHQIGKDENGTVADYISLWRHRY